MTLMTKSGRELTLVLRGRRLCADAASELEMELKRNLDGVTRPVMWQQVIKGAIIAAAVAIDLTKYRRK